MLFASKSLCAPLFISCWLAFAICLVNLLSLRILWGWCLVGMLSCWRIPPCPSIHFFLACFCDLLAEFVVFSLSLGHFLLVFACLFGYFGFFGGFCLFACLGLALLRF